MIKKAVIAIFILFQMFFAQPVLAQQQESSIAEAQIIKVVETTNQNGRTHALIKNVTLKILTGDLKDQILTIQDNILATPYELHYQPGDHMIITVSKGEGGKPAVYLTDYDRKPMLMLLLFLFLILTLIVAHKQGITSLIGMTASFYIIIRFIIPNILIGSDPLTVTFLGSLIIIPLTYYLAHGFNKKTTIAIVGTSITLLLTGLLAYLFSNLAKLTGFANEDALYLQNAQGGQINVKSLLLAGIIIGALAVLNDITVSQSSIVASLYQANPKLTLKELFEHAMAVGRDHVASLVNTLILVYVGASLPLVLLFNNASASIGLIANQEIIATEIVRTLVSSIGIIAAVPITTYLACLFVKKS